MSIFRINKNRSQAAVMESNANCVFRGPWQPEKEEYLKIENRKKEQKAFSVVVSRGFSYNHVDIKLSV